MRWIAASLLFATSCKSDPGPACPQVVDHMLEITKQQYGGHGGLELANRKQMIAECERRGYPRAMRVCLTGAKTLEDLGTCQKPDPPARAPDVPRGGSDVPGAPGGGSGSVGNP